MQNGWLDPLRAVASLFYPALCEGCGKALANRDQYLCPACDAAVPRIRAPFCARCSEPFSGAIEGTFSCANCSRRRLYFETAVSSYRSRGLARELVHRFKYRGEQYLRHPLADWIEQALGDSRLEGRRFDAVVPVPLHSAKERQRGFNQALLLAELLCARRGFPLSLALVRTRATTTQTAFDRVTRIRNLRGAFEVRGRTDVRGRHLLLLDDVLTTGSTLSECARTLRRAGAASVYAITAVRA